jgi:RNA recognition motif-containing protein
LVIILKLRWAFWPKVLYFIFLEVLVVKKLFVGSLPWAFTDDTLKSAFEPYGKVVSAKVIRDRESGRSRGFGFVEMENEADAEKAITALNESEVSGRKITVKEALSK